MKRNRNIRWNVTCALVALVLSPVCPAQELVGHWRFDQPNGEFPNLAGSSESAKVRSSENRGALPLVADQIGDMQQVVEFDGSGDAGISVPIRLADGDFTVEFWIKPDASGRDLMVLTNASGVIIWAKADGRLAFMLAREPEGWSYVEIPHAVVPGQWLHGMARVSNHTQQLFVEEGDEILRSQAKEVEDLKQYDWPRTSLGINFYGQAKPFQGRMAALKAYNGALEEQDFKHAKP